MDKEQFYDDEATRLELESLGINQSCFEGGLDNLVSGYLKYALEVIKNRALPDGRDGLKPVNRRILETLYTSKVKTLQKCQEVAGNTLKLHPHGDRAVYSALVRMVDLNMSLNIPTIKGHGTFGAIYKTDAPAAPRYTECMLHENAYDYFGEMDGIDMIPNYNNTGKEPAVLPVSYPALLCNASSGIAVGFRCNFPAFNFNDVLDLTIERLKTGKCTSVIYPDFSSGGYYIKNEKEIKKIMLTGKGRLKLRGKVRIDGKHIEAFEYPYGVTLQYIKKQIEDKNLDGVQNVSDYDGYDTSGLLNIECRSKNRVDDVLLSLYRDTDLQSTFSVDMTAIVDDKPLTKGVYGWIEVWIDWRKGVLTKQYTKMINAWKEELPRLRALMKLIQNTDVRDTMSEMALHKSDADAIKVLQDTFKDDEDFSYDTCNWLVNRRLSQLRDGGKYKLRYDKLMSSIEEYQNMLDNLDATIISQLEKLKAEKGKNFPRKTELTSTDYNFTGTKEEEVKDESLCYYSYKDGFIRKLSYPPSNADEYTVIEGLACDTLIGIDNKGRILRIYGENLPYSNDSEMGIYLPKHLNLDVSSDYKVLWLDKLDGRKKMLTYSDGTVGFLDTSEWLDNTRKVKVIEKGISPHADKLFYVGDVPDYLFVCDTECRMSQTPVALIKQKARTARTRVFNCNGEMAYVAYTNVEDGMTLINNMQEHSAPKMTYIDLDADLVGDEELFKESNIIK